MKFVKFTEYNDHEGESWNFWLQFDGNEQQIDKLLSLLKEFDGRDDCYELDLKTVDESEVDILVKHTGSGYYPYNNKVVGEFFCPTIETELLKDEFEDQAFEWLDDNFYKGRIKEMFRN